MVNENNAQQTTTALARFANPAFVGHDIKMIGRYVKRDLFPDVVFIWRKSSLNPGGILYNDYMLKCKRLFMGDDGPLAGCSDGVVDNYMKVLWEKMVDEGCYLKWMSEKRSNTYQTIEHGFHSK